MLFRVVWLDPNLSSWVLFFNGIGIYVCLVIPYASIHVDFVQFTRNFSGTRLLALHAGMFLLPFNCLFLYEFWSVCTLPTAC